MQSTKKYRISGPRLRPSDSLIGHVSGRLTVVALAVASSSQGRKWLCQCECGGTTITTATHLRNGHTVSCGCITADRLRTHGHTVQKKPTLTFKTWESMRARVFRPTETGYQYYGGRGITICERWDHFENFLADMGERPSRAYTLDRINVQGNYEPDNCRWATVLEQNRNRTNTLRLMFNGESLTIGEWSERLGVAQYIIRGRRQMGWSIERILTEPVIPKKRIQRGG